MDIQREVADGKVVLYIPCLTCHNRLFLVDGYPLSGAQAEEELRAGFKAHVEDHEREAVARHR